MSGPKEAIDRPAPAVTFTEEQTPLGDWVFTLACAEHGAVTSVEVYRTFSQDLIEGAFLFWALDLPLSVSDEEVSRVAMRSMLGRLLELRFDCPDGLRPFARHEVLPDGRRGLPS